MLREGLLFLSHNRLARGLVTHAPFARTAARRFVAGERLDEAVRVARELNEAGMHVSLDYLGEAVTTREEARAAADVALGIVERIAAEKLDANISVKLTQMGQEIDEPFLRDNAGRILDAARAHDLFVRFDMEGSDTTERTLHFFHRVWEEGYRNVGVVIQSYLYRSAADIDALNELGARVRLCKGAYQEPKSVAYPDKTDVDASFVRLMKKLLDHGTYPGIATHDEAMIRATEDHVAEAGIDRSAFEFQMLYGVRRDLQQRLVKSGFNVRIYVPFGDAWYPYLMRRMAERPANVFFIVNNVLRESPLGFLVGGNGHR